MYRLLVVSGEQTDYEVPPWAVEGNGISYNICDGSAFYGGQNGHTPPESEGVLLDVESLTQEQMDQVIRYCQHSHLPVLGVVPANRLDRYVPNASIDDFIVYPYNPQELVKRMDWVLTRAGEAWVQRGCQDRGPSDRHREVRGQPGGPSGYPDLQGVPATGAPGHQSGPRVHQG